MLFHLERFRRTRHLPSRVEKALKDHDEGDIVWASGDGLNCGYWAAADIVRHFSKTPASREAVFHDLQTFHETACADMNAHFGDQAEVANILEPQSRSNITSETLQNVIFHWCRAHNTEPICVIFLQYDKSADEYHFNNFLPHDEMVDPPIGIVRNSGFHFEAIIPSHSPSETADGIVHSSGSHDKANAPGSPNTATGANPGSHDQAIMPGPSETGADTVHDSGSYDKANAPGSPNTTARADPGSHDQAIMPGPSKTDTEDGVDTKAIMYEMAEILERMRLVLEKL